MKGAIGGGSAATTSASAAAAAVAASNTGSSSSSSPGTKDKRVIPVVEPEKTRGNVEYKRQLLRCTPTRLEKLKTQMSYRLDQGDGECLYRIGIEDDGCHSLVDYGSCAATAEVLELLARGLNAVVVDRVMIQGEIHPSEVADGGRIVVLRRCENDGNDDDDRANAVVVVREDSLLGDGKDPSAFRDDDDDDDDGGKRRGTTASTVSTPVVLNKARGVYTRCDLTIRRVETHLLDPSPILRAAAVNGEAKEPDDETASPTAGGATSREEDEGPVSVGETLSSRNLRVAVVGNVDAGKSTMIGTLTSGVLDDGRGSSRTSIMKHKHEIESGRTSTSSSHLLGFRSSGQSVVAAPPPNTGDNNKGGAGGKSNQHRRKTEDEIARESHRVVTLMDLAGHERYLKTTIHGVASGMADYALVLVNGRHPPTHMTHHHLNLCVSFGIHVVVVFTKVDGCPEHAFENSKNEVRKLLRRPDIGKKPFDVETEADVGSCLGKLGSIAPMVSTSCVTGEGVDLLRKLLFALPKRRRHERKADRSFEYLVDDVFNVPGVGSVVSGFVNAGRLKVGPHAHVYVGPTDDGSFLKTVAKSAHIARIPTDVVTSGQSACLALALSKDHRKKLRRGMVVLEQQQQQQHRRSSENKESDNAVPPPTPPTSTREFEAEICVLKGEGTTIRKTYQAYVHILNVRQSAYARKIEIVPNASVQKALAATSATGHRAAAAALYGGGKEDDDDDDEEEEEIVLRPGSRAKVRFEFAQRPEYVRPGMRMLFRDGRVRGVGLVTGVPSAASEQQPAR